MLLSDETWKLTVGRASEIDVASFKPGHFKTHHMAAKKKGRVMGRKINQEEVYRSLTRHKEEPALLLVCGGVLMALCHIKRRGLGKQAQKA